MEDARAYFLRGSENSPAHLSLTFAINSGNIYPGRRGRPTLNLLDMIRRDLKSKNLQNDLCDIHDFYRLKMLALDRKAWKNV